MARSPELLTVAAVPDRCAAGVLRIAVAGDVDTASAPMLRGALVRAAEAHRVRLDGDATMVAHCSHSGLRVLVDVQDTADDLLVLVGAGRPIRRVVDVLHLRGRFGVEGGLVDGWRP